VATDDLALNPPEALVFGGAVLLHDAAMTLAAYPGGLADIKATPEWADTMAIRKDPSNVGASTATSEIELEAQVTVEVLRSLHARQAAELATQGWLMPRSGHDGEKQDNFEKTYLIENSDLRRFYGPKIGTIAHSHWWPIAKVERDLGGYLGGMENHSVIVKLRKSEFALKSPVQAGRLALRGGEGCCASG
jgi:hypothetical protein